MFICSTWGPRNGKGYAAYLIPPFPPPSILADPWTIFTPHRSIPAVGFLCNGGLMSFFFWQLCICTSYTIALPCVLHCSLSVCSDGL